MTPEQIERVKAIAGFYERDAEFVPGTIVGDRAKANAAALTALLEEREHLEIGLAYSTATVDLVKKHRDEAVAERDELRSQVAALLEENARLREAADKAAKSALEYLRSADKQLMAFEWAENRASAFVQRANYDHLVHYLDGARATIRGAPSSERGA